MTKHRYSDEQLKDAVANSISIRQVLLLLNIAAAGGNYFTMKKKIRQLSIDTSHFKGQGHSKGKYFGPKRPTEDYLSNQFPTHSNSLRKRLIKEGYFKSCCSKCNLDKWMDLPIPLELHHIDGNHQNNQLDNLTLLCPNCHSQTENHRGKNKRLCKT